MGYLSQKKKYARESSFLRLMAILFGLLTFILLLQGNALGVKNWLFQIYLVNILVFVYALYIGRVLYGVFMAFLLVLNYFLVASSTPVFLNTDISAEHQIAIAYAPEQVFEVATPGARVLRRGHLVLNNKNIAPFAAIETDGHVFTLVRVDLRKTSAAKRKIALQQLRNFISEQDDPLIVFGDFGAPAWSAEMKQFMEDTRLEVKNRLLFTDKGHRFNLLRAPGFYILAFQNVGVEKLQVAYPQNSKTYPLIKAELGFY